MSPRALPRPGDPDAPKYWRDEIGGQLAGAVLRYLNGNMTLRDVALMRAYLSQWIQSPVWDMVPDQTGEGREALSRLRAGVGAIVTVADISAWLHASQPGPKPRSPRPAFLPRPTEPWESRRARYLRETGRSEPH